MRYYSQYAQTEKTNSHPDGERKAGSTPAPGFSHKHITIKERCKMNKYKKYIKSLGFKLKSDYPYMPYPVKGKSPFSPGYILIESIHVSAEHNCITVFYNVYDVSYYLNRAGELIEAPVELY